MAQFDKLTVFEADKSYPGTKVNNSVSMYEVKSMKGIAPKPEPRLFDTYFSEKLRKMEEDKMRYVSELVDCRRTVEEQLRMIEESKQEVKLCISVKKFAFFRLPGSQCSKISQKKSALVSILNFKSCRVALNMLEFFVQAIYYFRLVS